MNKQVYFCCDLLRMLRKRRNQKKAFYMLGFQHKEIYIVFELISCDLPQLADIIREKGKIAYCRILGYINELPKKRDSSLYMIYDPKTRYPFVIPKKYEIYNLIFFEPPNFRNLEYFSIDPMLLQSTDTSGMEKDTQYKDVLTDLCLSKRRTEVLTISDSKVLERINDCLKSRTILKEQLGRRKTLSDINSSKFSEVMLKIREIVSHGMIAFVTNLQRVIISVIWILNYEVFNTKLIDISHVMRQLNLRLQQLNYFPVQFLCYTNKISCDKTSVLDEVKVPTKNSSLNFYNSNYINLYNSLWLVANDVIFGITAWGLIKLKLGVIDSFSWQVLVKDFLFNRFNNIISWVSFNYPAGFKLNNELGRFMGELFISALQVWEFIVMSISRLALDESYVKSQQWPLLSLETLIDKRNTISFYSKIFPTVLRTLINVLCYCGFSFLLCFAIDCFRLLTFHIYCFYSISARIYRRQLEILKSLFQLFRGKKYNILRNRTDNLNNYSTPSQYFEVDELLVGTLLFMILMLLLPTIFAFYLMFFLARLACIITLNFLENILIFVNFIPLFMLLLKLKNSNRLQGGIKFDYLFTLNNTNVLFLSNNSLTFNEIFHNFVNLLRKSKDFKGALVKLFFIGEHIGLRYNDDMLFRYLSLPEDYTKTPEIWKVLG